MSVSVRIPTILRTYTGGESEVPPTGATLAEVLDDLDGSYAGIKGRILDEGRAAPVRERVRRQRRRALPREPGDPTPDGARSR
jgi:molybdopterin synthase sulfur carrier subunit